MNKSILFIIFLIGAIIILAGWAFGIGTGIPVWIFFVDEVIGVALMGGSGYLIIKK